MEMFLFVQQEALCPISNIIYHNRGSVNGVVCNAGPCAHKGLHSEACAWKHAALSMPITQETTRKLTELSLPITECLGTKFSRTTNISPTIPTIHFEFHVPLKLPPQGILNIFLTRV